MDTVAAEDMLTWAPLVLTADKVDDLWLKIQEFPMAFDDFSQGDFNSFVQKLTSPRNVFLDIGEGKGLACGTNVRPRLDASIHLIMFDRKLRGREEVFRQIIREMFAKFKLRRMTAYLADTASTGIKLVERLGFHHEGTVRESLILDGKYVDMHIYGLLREEVE